MLSRWQLDLLISGWAIAYKARTLKLEWSEHLSQTKQFLLKTLSGGTELHVLGAGRLFDFPLEEIAGRYEKIHLYDGDPGAIRYLTRVANKFPNLDTHQTDLTDGLSEFNQKINNIDQVKGIFSDPSLTKHSPNSIRFSKNCQVVSLNILSQLPLAFRQIFERWLIKKYGKIYLKNEEQSWLEEYNVLASRILISHLELLKSSVAEKIVLISDTEQLFYPKSGRPLPRPNAAPFSWEIDFEMEKALEVTSSICQLEFEKVDALFPGYAINNKSFWAWYLTPARRDKEGVICRVDAVELLKQ